MSNLNNIESALRFLTERIGNGAIDEEGRQIVTGILDGTLDENGDPRCSEHSDAPCQSGATAAFEGPHNARFEGSSGLKGRVVDGTKLYLLIDCREHLVMRGTYTPPRREDGHLAVDAIPAYLAPWEAYLVFRLCNLIALQPGGMAKVAAMCNDGPGMAPHLPDWQ